MPWSGFFFDLEAPVQFQGDLTAIALEVFSIVPGQSVLLKLENSNNPSQFKELVQVTTSENQWERLTYHFSVADSNQFDRLVLIMNSTFQNTEQMTYYLDSITLTEPKEVPVATPSFTNLVWSDEFDYQGRPDETKWHHQTFAPNNGSWFNGELQHYVNSEENTYVSDGTLKVKAIKESYTTQSSTKDYTSARLNSKFSMTYGKIEVRAKLPSGAGTWPAIWTLGANIDEPGNFYGDSQGSVGWPLCGEIDIMEQNGWDKTQVYGHFHWGNTATAAYENYGKIATVANTSTEFHVYSLVWTETELQIFIDDALNVVLDNTALNPYDNPHYLLLNIAVGGNLGGTVPANFSQEVMEVDYVRFYQ
ncbi:MAG: glycoside hydrolase family 16 protein [Flavobacteriaceae bacterium]|nr:glycoside hydrolase family 16 protein [Flavobacteriaceae bacterium]NVJ72058.1 glycoside hydrolase family 16 protein [Flavobacteriaceae bacterium]